MLFLQSDPHIILIFIFVEVTSLLAFINFLLVILAEVLALASEPMLDVRSHSASETASDA